MDEPSALPPINPDDESFPVLSSIPLSGMPWPTIDPNFNISFPPIPGRGIGEYNLGDSLGLLTGMNYFSPPPFNGFLALSPEKQSPVPLAVAYLMPEGSILQDITFNIPPLHSRGPHITFTQTNHSPERS